MGRDEELQQLLKLLRDLAQHAGRTMRSNFGRPIRAQWKLDHTMVTEVDTMNHGLVVAAAERSAAQGIPLDVMGEEGNLAVDGARYTIIADEVDGTALLARGIPLSVFSIAIVDSNGRPVVAVVEEPLGMYRRQYWAVHGGGAYMMENDVTTPLRVSDRPLGQKSMIDAEWWPSAPREHNFMPALNAYSVRSGTYVVTLGSVIAAFMAVARGAFEACVFAGATADKLVDSAAATLIIREAGGDCMDLRGNRNLCYRGQPIPGILATNGRPDVAATLLRVCGPQA